MSKYAVATIKKNKLRYTKQVIGNSWVDFWKTSIYWNYREFLVPFSNKVCIGIWHIQSTLLLFLKISFLLLCPFYIVAFLKTRKISFELMAVIIVLITSILQAVVTYGNNSRFSYPFEFLMIIVVLSFIRNYVPEKFLK